MLFFEIPFWERQNIKKHIKQIFDLNFHLDFPNPTSPKIEPPRLPLARDGYVFFLGFQWWQGGRGVVQLDVSQLPAMTFSRIGAGRSPDATGPTDQIRNHTQFRKPKPVEISMHAGFHPYRST